ncbi:MAG: gliding motility-associated C-terminal domain-containing protein [Bacteroidia bacterium]
MKNINRSKWFFLIIFFPLCNFGQNLVQNPGFEQHSALPVFLSSWPLVTGWTNAGNSITTPDYYHSGSTSVATGLPNSQFAQIIPFSDSAIMGYYAYETISTSSYREYLQTRLLSPLIPGMAYQVSLSLSTGKTKPAGFGGTNGAGVHLSPSPVSQASASPAYFGPINITPVWHLPHVLWDSAWQTFSFIYLPANPDEYLTIGNFLSDQATAKFHPDGAIPSNFASYIYVDEVSVTPTLIVQGNDTICQGDTVFLSASLAPSWKWIAEGGTGQPLATTSSLVATPSATTTFLVISGPDTARHTVTVIPRQTLNLGPDTSICAGDSLRLNAQLPNAQSYLWQDGSNSPAITVFQEGIYFVNVTHTCDLLSDTIEIDVSTPPGLVLSPGDTTLCPGESLRLSAGAGVVWENGSRDTIRIIQDAGLYIAEISNRCGTARDSVQINEGFAATVNLGNDTTLCTGQTLLLETWQDGEANYLWSGGSKEPFLMVETPGIFSVSVTTICGVWRDEIQVNFLEPPVINLGKDTILCEDRKEILLLNVYQPFASYHWQDGSNNPYFEVNQAGRYEVEISNICGTISDEIQVDYTLCDCSLFFPNAFTPNEDGVNETFGAKFSCEIGSWQMEIFDRWGKRILSTGNPDYQWDGTFRGKDCPEGVYVWKLRYHQKNQPLTEKGGTVTLIR